MISLFLLLAATGPDPGRTVLWVDLQVVIENLPDTESIMKQVDFERRRRAAIIDRKLQDATPEERRDSAFLDRLEADRVDHEKQLERLEARLLLPLLERVQAMLPPDVVSLDRAPILDPKPECSRTAWLKKKAWKQEAPLPAPTEACRFRRLYEVDFDRAMQKSELGRRTAKMLDQVRDDRQREVDKEVLAGQKPEAVAERYRVEQAALAEREGRAKADLEAKIFDVLKKLEGPDVLFLERPAEGKGALPACDITEWVAEAMDGGTARPNCP